MKIVTIEIPDNCDLIYENGEVKLIDTAEKEKESILNEIQVDISTLYNKYEERLKGKFGVRVSFAFTPYRDGNRKKVTHWVEKNNSIEIVDGEQCWHD